MNITEFKKIFFAGISAYCKDNSLSVSKGKLEVTGVYSNVTARVSFSYSKYADTIVLLPWLEVDVPEIENEYDGRKISNKGTLSFRFMCLEVLYESGYKKIKNAVDSSLDRVSITNTDDALKFIEDFIFIHRTFLSRYVTEYGNVSAVNEVFNKKPKLESYHHSAYVHQIFSGLLAAKKLKCCSLSKLISIYDKEMIDSSEVNIHLYNELKNNIIIR